MDKQDIITQLILDLTEDVKTLNDRVIRLEERVSWRAMLAGVIAGALPAIGTLAYVWLSR